MPIEAELSRDQKENLEEARRRLGFRSRADVFRWFADNVLDIIDVLESQETPYAMIQRRKPPEV